MNGYQNYYRGGPRYDRIDQDEVPESKHTVFIRGLPGHIKTDEIKDFFEDHVGPCSFDFIKLSQDQLKLFVAVRFETRDAAKECMHKYKDGELLGYPIEMTWFRDIRRYVSYQQSQGLRPATVPRNRHYNNRNRSSYDRSSRNDYRDDDYERGSKAKRASPGDRYSDRKKSRSRSRSSSRSRSHSPRRSRDRSHSHDSRHSHQSEARSRSRTQVTSNSPSARNRTASPPQAPSPQVQRDVIEKGSTPPLPPSPPPETAAKTPNGNDGTKRSPSASVSPTTDRKLRKTKRDKKKRKKRSPSSASSSFVEEQSEELSEGELRKKILKRREKAMKVDNSEVPKPIAKPMLGKWEEQEPAMESTLLQNTTLKFGLESTEDIPKHVIRGATPQMQVKKGFPYDVPSSAAPKQEANDVQLVTPSRTAKADPFAESFSSFKKAAKEPGKMLDISKAEAASASLFNTDIDDLLGKRTHVSMLDDLKTSQTAMYGASRAQQAQVSMRTILDEPEEPMQPTAGGLRLSSFTRQLNAGTERERKLARLPPELFSKYAAKKKQLEGAFKADRETFGFVVKTLISKDPDLEDRLRLALVEAVKDMEDAFTQKMDQYLDQLIMFISM